MKKTKNVLIFLGILILFWIQAMAIAAGLVLSFTVLLYMVSFGGLLFIGHFGEILIFLRDFWLICSLPVFIFECIGFPYIYNGVKQSKNWECVFIPAEILIED